MVNHFLVAFLNHSASQILVFEVLPHFDLYPFYLVDLFNPIDSIIFLPSLVESPPVTTPGVPGINLSAFLTPWYDNLLKIL
jgi:hypothetical protein